MARKDTSEAPPAAGSAPTAPPPDLGANTGGTAVGPGNGQRVSKNNPEARKAIHVGFERIKELEADRAEINADIKAERERLVALGFNKQGLKDAERLWKMTEEQRAGYDETTVTARAAMQIDILPAPDPAGGATKH